MHSSTSSSRRRGWLSYLALAALLSVIALAAVEVWLRHYGAEPSLRNSNENWAYIRHQLEQEQSAEAIALLGASRVQNGLDHRAIGESYPGWPIYNLSYAGKGPRPTIKDIADNSGFRGTVIVSIIPAWIIPGHVYDGQVQLVDYYHNSWNWARLVDTWASRQMNGTFAFKFHQYSLLTVARNFLKTGRPFEHPVYVLQTPSRELFSRFEYAKLDGLRAQRVRAYTGNLTGTQPDPETWQQYVAAFSESLNKIVARGGKVVVIRMPTNGPVYAIEQETFPRKLYWDTMAAALDVPTLHFEDAPELTGWDLPDYSHLTHENRDDFTRLLFARLQKMGAIPPPQ